MNVRAPALLVGLGSVLFVSVVVAFNLGSVHIGVDDMVRAVVRKLGRADVASNTNDAVLFAIRAPRVVLGALVGASLAVSGAAMQAIFRNPLVDPGLLGVSSGAACGAVSAIVMGTRVLAFAPEGVRAAALPIFAFAGALGAMTLAERLARTDGRTRVATLLLAGIGVNAVAIAITGAMTFAASDAELRSITFWTFGSLGAASWRTIGVLLPFVLVTLLFLPSRGRILNVMLLGESEAVHLGVDADREKRKVFFVVALGVGASVAAVGMIGFVGLVVPHIVRLLHGPDQRVVLPASALLGASLVLITDGAARTLVSPAEIPLGIVTAGLGAPVFLSLLFRQKAALT